MERWKTGEIIRISTVKSQKLGQNRKIITHAPHTAHWLSKVKEGERKRKEEEKKKMEKERKGRRKGRRKGIKGVKTK